MNRQQRRAMESNDRREAKHPTKSFEDLVGAANRKALEPFILNVVAEVEQGIRRDISRLLLEENARLQTRLMVLEKLAMEHFGETSETLGERILVVEDEATGHEKTDTIQAGDLVRLTFQVKPPTEKAEFSQPQNVILHKVAQAPNPNVAFQTYKELEEGLIGATVGETREIPVNINPTEREDGGVTYVFKAKVDRISRPKAQPAPAAVEPPAGEESNATN